MTDLTTVSENGQQVARPEMTLADGVQAMLSRNTNPSLSFDFWSFNQVESEITAKPDLVARLTAKLQKAADSGDQDEMSEAFSEIRKYKRTGLIALRTQKTIITDGEGDDGMEREVVVFYDPYLQKEVAMKQTMLVSTVKKMNKQYRDSQQDDTLPEFAIAGAAFDIEYKGRPMGQNGRKYDNFDVRLSENQPNA